MITINLTGDDRVAQFLKAIQGSAESRLVRTALGEEVTQQVKSHLYDRDKTPNRLGGKRTHFYRQAGDATAYALTKDGAVVSINKKGVRQRLKGGTITPKNATWLTIPIHRDAHGKRAREFDNLFPVKGVLARPKGDDDIEPIFALKKKVKQKPDPIVIPSDKAIAATARQTVFNTVETILKRRRT